MKKNNIQKNLNKVDRNTKIVNKFDNFCKTKRAEELVKDINRLNLEDLIRKYNLQYLYKLRPCGSKSAIIQFIRQRLYKNGVNHDYTHIFNGKFVRRKDINFKLPWNLTKEEISSIWKKKENTKLGYADKLRRLEQHKIDRWERKHKPTFEELKQDLFPRVLIRGFLDLRDKKQEDIRDMLSAKYPPKDSCNITVRYYSEDGTTINEKIFGHMYDPQHIIDKHPSYYTIQKKSLRLKNIANVFRDKAVQMYGNDFICLKVFCHGSNERIGMWIQKRYSFHNFKY